jgi:geranylgeranyl reductase family protein
VDTYDAIVVGGGPAGATAGRRLALNDLSVLVIDKARFPRSKTCAGGITDPVERALDFSIESVVHREAYGQTLFSPSGIRVDCTRPEKSGSLVMREEFDTLLLRKAVEAGAEVREGVEAVAAEQDDTAVTVITADGDRIRGSYLLAADGINSAMAKSLGFYSGWTGDSAAICIEVEAEVGEEAVLRVCGVPQHKEGCSIHIYFGPVPHGYIWCFPKRSVLSIGAGCRQDKAQNMREHFNDWFEDFKEQHNLHPKILSDTVARVPFGGAAKKTAMGRTLLLGDAAGFVNPYDAEGILYAIRSGIIAASVVTRAVNRSESGLISRYEPEWRADFGEVLKVGKDIAKLLFKSTKNMETVLGLGARDPVINDVMYKMIAGLDSYKKLKSTLVKRIMLKHPREGLSLYT